MAHSMNWDKSITFVRYSWVAKSMATTKNLNPRRSMKHLKLWRWLTNPRLHPDHFNYLQKNKTEDELMKRNEKRKREVNIVFGGMRWAYQWQSQFSPTLGDIRDDVPALHFPFHCHLRPCDGSHFRPLPHCYCYCPNYHMYLHSRRLLAPRIV